MKGLRASLSDPPTQREMAELLNVGWTSIQAGRKVLQSGTGALVAAVAA